ncbi:type II secretion system F family protein [Photobacterium nomapromontoriensis]|uniref:type II secretion system F family protein n=1 Tax=Photobacterium nomapromontoriensis TaxID=2910237 RepID=UPI003D12C0A5
MTILMSIFISCLLLAWLITFSIQRKTRSSTISQFLFQQHKSKLSQLNDVLVKFGKAHTKELSQKFIEAGIYNTKLARFYFPLKIAVASVCCSVIAFSELAFDTQLMMGFFSIVVVIIGPDMALAIRKRALIKKTSRQLPYMLDMMAVCVQTGMTLEASLTYLGIELEAFDRDLCFHIKKTSDSARVYGLEKALNDFSHRIPTPEVRSFTLTLIQNLQHGTSIASVLSDLAEDMRKMQLLSVEEKIGKLSAKMSVPLILLIMFPIVILILAPEVMQMSISVGG